MSRYPVVARWISRLLLLAQLLSLPSRAGDVRPKISFVGDVAPVLQARCVSCHGKEKAKGGYRLHTYEAFRRPGTSGEEPIVPGNPDRSLVFKLMIATDVDDRMPLNTDPLSREQIELIRGWILQGAIHDGADPGQVFSELLPPPFHAAPPVKYPFGWPVTAVQMDASGENIFAAGYREIFQWSLAGNRVLHRWTNFPERIHSIVTLPKQQLLLAGGGVPGSIGEVRQVDVRSGGVVSVPFRGEDVVWNVAAAPGMEKWVMAGADGTLRLFETGSGKQTSNFDLHSDWVRSVAFSRDGARMVTASRDRSARVVDAVTGEVISSYLEHKSSVTCAVFADEDKLVVSGGNDRKLHLWQAADGKKISEISGFDGVLAAVVLDGDNIYSACSDGLIRQHSLNGRKLVRVLAKLGSPAESMSHSRDIQTLVVGTRGGEVYLVRTDTGNTRLAFKTGAGDR